MLSVVSPAKKMDFERSGLPQEHSELDFQKDTKELLKTAKKLKASDLKALMKISEDLSSLNYERFQGMKFPFTADNAKQAAFAFAGDTYVGLDAKTLSDEDIAYAQDHLRILSGLYGLVRPLDLIQPYRLEMGTRLTNTRGENLYDFWGDRLARKINEELADHKSKVLVNVASNEYFKAIKRKSLNVEVITPVFKEVKNDVAKVIGFSAKRARGMMARYLTQNRVETPDGIKDFAEAGYKFQPALSTESEYQFHRVVS